MSHFEPWTRERAAAIIAEFAGTKGATMPILHEIQHAFGFVPEAAIPMIADALNLSRAEVYGTVTFYHEFRHELPGRHVVRLCRAEACQSMGGDALAERAEKRLGIKLGETTPDRRVTLEPIYCLGLCATAPSAQVDDRMVGRLTESKLDAILTEAQS
ncbi:formate dehydrogenase subunit gamma [Flaviflagellibacter deserti]|uniref:Formate dehydrogenase subunit gamma n=1 Tax=Flaviflagellibacter deserti TaxID=2267266 RepID=A0ABV9Z046_9HYPH